MHNSRSSEAMIAGIKPVLDCIGFVPSKGIAWLPGDPMPWTIVDRCQMAWSDFKEFTRSAAHGAVVHAFTVLRSHYPSMDLEQVVSSFARGMNATKITKLEDKAEEPVNRLAENIDLFDKGGSGAQ